MKKGNKMKLVIAVVAFVLLMVGAYQLYNTLGKNVNSEAVASQQKASQDYSLAPDFIVYDQDGKEVKLSDYNGKPIVLNFWASWCGPCQMEMPEFEAKYKELGEDVHFLMVNMTDGGRETMEGASEFIQRGGYSFPVVFDTKQNAAMAYGVFSLPTTYFIDADGLAVAQARGAIDASTLQQGIDMIR